MTTLKTLALTAALSLFAGSAALAADSMKSDAMMKADAAQMKACKAMGDKAKANPKCMAMMKKTDAMKGDGMKSDAMKSDAMKGDSMAAEHH
jgi:phage-related protein